VNREPFITCALTGSGDTAAKHPGLPVKPGEIVESAIEAARAGAAIVHVHVRDPSTGAPSRDLELYREVVEGIRARDDEVLINLTTGMGGDLVVGDAGASDTPAPGSDLVGPEERLAHVAELRPEICTLDFGSMNYGDDLVYVSPASYLERMAGLLRELGVKPEIEVFELGHLEAAANAIDVGWIEPPPFLQFCLGVPYGAPATPEAMLAMQRHAPPEAVWSGFGVGASEMPMVAQAVLLGGNVRVGLEDNLYLDRGVLASNAQLVERAREIIERMGARVAGPEAVRDRLGLK
jgi:uncharacterized protein (DUF849 family)